MRKFLIFLFSIFYFLFISTAIPCYADVKIEDYFGPAKTFPTLGSLISALLPNVFIIAGVLLFILLIFGGLSVIISAGKGDSEGAGKGKNMVTWAIIGFILIFASFWIIQIISYITGIDFLKPPV